MEQLLSRFGLTSKLHELLPGLSVGRVVLAMAVAGAEADPAVLDPHYAEGMVAVYNEYFGLPSAASRSGVTAGVQ